MVIFNVASPKKNEVIEAKFVIDDYDGQR